MKSGVSRKVKMGASLITALKMGAIGVILSSVPTRAVNTQGQLQAPSAQRAVTCGVYDFRNTYYVYAYATSSCPYAQVQTAIDCTNTRGFVGYAIGRTSTSSCPYGQVRYRERGAARIRLSPSSPWSKWIYYP
jgi:hypothetical protein